MFCELVVVTSYILLQPKTSLFLGFALIVHLNQVLFFQVQQAIQLAGLRFQLVLLRFQEGVFGLGR